MWLLDCIPVGWSNDLNLPLVHEGRCKKKVVCRWNHVFCMPFAQIGTDSSSFRASPESSRCGPGSKISKPSAHFWWYFFRHKLTKLSFVSSISVLLARVPVLLAQDDFQTGIPGSQLHQWYVWCNRLWSHIHIGIVWHPSGHESAFLCDFGSLLLTKRFGLLTKLQFC